MNNEKKGMIFYKSYYEAIKTLSKSKQIELYDAIVEYGLFLKVPKLSGSVKGMFELIKPNMEANFKKYENGKKGGRPKAKDNQSETKEKPKDNQSETEAKHKELRIKNKELGIKNKELKLVEEELKEEKTPPATNTTLFDFMENAFGRTLGGMEYEVISTWEDNELTRYAIKQAVLVRAFSVRYIERILQNYKKENIKTVTEAEERDRRYQEQKNNKKTYERKKTVQERLRELEEEELKKEVENDKSRSI